MDSDCGGGCFSAGPIVIGLTLLMKKAEHVKDEHDQQYRAQPDPGPAPAAPSRMTVIASAAAEKQQQNDDEDQHGYFSNTCLICPTFFWILPARCSS